MYHPTLDEVRQISAALQERPEGTVETRRPLLPLCSDLLADIETPVSAYCKTARGPYSFLLESVEGGERIARYSFIGIDPYMVMTLRGEHALLRHIRPAGERTRSEEVVACHDPLQLIEAELEQYRLVAPASLPPDALPRFHGGAVGYLAYETVARFESLPVPEHDELGLPLAVFSFTETMLVFDHLKHRLRIVTHLHLDAPNLASEYRRALATLDDVQQRLRQPVRLPEEPAPIDDKNALKVVSNRTREEFETMVRRSIDYIRAGDAFQIVPSQRLRRHVNAAPFTVYRALRAINPSPYMFYL